MGTSLPSKEANLFRLIVKCYETKQYKKGLKAADQVLKKFPDHGETQAMKGLILNCLERKEEAYDLVRKGLKNDLKSHVCWHVYGLLYRSDREYKEATKCYKAALKQDQGNHQILRDLSLLQAQLRDHAGFVETRRQLLTLKPQNRGNWIAFAVSQHLSSNHQVAIQILEAYEGTLESGPPSEERYEHSEMLLYKAMLYEEAEQLENALKHLEEKEDLIVDKLAVLEQRASILLQLKRHEEAEKVYRQLTGINPDNYNYFRGLEASLKLVKEGSKWTDDQVEHLTKLYKELADKYPRSAAAKRIPLDFLQGEAFRDAIDQYARGFLRKGVPSLFSDLRPLYDQPGKADILDCVFCNLELSLREKEAFPPNKTTPEPQKEAPTSLLWTLFLLAQHYDRRRQYDLALQKIDEAIQHTPTVVDLYLVKARILKHVGDPVAAAAYAEEARSMDLADRFLNSECVKRLLKSDQAEEAEKTASLFTKDGDQGNSLFDMQCMWYELAAGNSHLRKKAYGKALKKYLAIEKHYADMVEDQFDFHTYCLRKMTLRAYINMLRMEDHLHSFKPFCKGAAGAIRTYLELYDHPPKAAQEEEDAAMAAMSPADRKKLRAKQRKEQARAKKAEEQKKEEEAAAAAAAAAASEKKGQKKGQPAKPADPDPDGVKLAQVDDPLEEAVKLLELLKTHAADSLETHLLAFELYLRRHKLLLALQALKRLLRLQPNNAQVHRCLVRFFHTVDSQAAPESPSQKLVQQVIDAERREMSALKGKSLKEYNESFLKQHSGSLPHRAAAAESLLLLSPEEKESALAIIQDSKDKGVERGGALAAGVGEWELKDCVAVHRLLKETFKDEKAASRWRDRCVAVFRYSLHFEGPKSSAVIGLPPRLGSQVTHDEGGANKANGILEE